MANESYHVPDPYHPNFVETHIEEARKIALEQSGLAAKVAKNGYESLTSEEAAQVGQMTAERLKALEANVNQHSE